MSELALPGTLTETSLELPDNLTFDQWRNTGQTLKRIDQSVKWWIGDWLNYGEKNYPEKWAQAVEATEYDQETLRKAAWVAASVPRGTRRDSLPYRHHEVVASLPPDEQKKWLDEAEPAGEGEPPRYSSRELAEKIRPKPKNVEMVDVGTCPHCGAIFNLRDADIRTESAR